MSVPLPGRVLAPGPGTFRALRHRDFRVLWLGQLISLIGTWMQSLAQGWLVFRLTDSALFLGFVGFAGYLPTLLFALPAGVAADRLPRRLALFWTQGTAMALSLVLATLTALDIVRPWQVAALAFGLGLVATLDIPVRQALLYDLVGRDDLPNAIALNSLAFNAARFVGPFVGGLLLAARGEAWVFLANAISYAAVLGGLAAMRGPWPSTDAAPFGWAGEIRAGLGFVLRQRRMRAILALVVVAGVCATPYAVLLPVFARDILAVGSHGLGFMMAASGLGAVSGALGLAGRRGRPRGLGPVVISAAVLGASLVLFSFAHALAPALACLFLIGAAMMVLMATSNTLLQLMAPAELRGRVISLYMLAFMGTAPLGSLAGGLLARRIGAPRAVALGGAVCAAGALCLAAHERWSRDGDPP